MNLLCNSQGRIIYSFSTLLGSLGGGRGTGHAQGSESKFTLLQLLTIEMGAILFGVSNFNINLTSLSSPIQAVNRGALPSNLCI